MQLLVYIRTKKTGLINKNLILLLIIEKLSLKYIQLLLTIL